MAQLHFRLIGVTSAAQSPLPKVLYDVRRKLFIPRLVVMFDPSRGEFEVSAEAVLAVFAKYPRQGRVKTRMQSAYSPRLCLRIHCALMEDTLLRAARWDGARCLFLADAEPEELRETALRFPDWTVEPQEGADLGARIENAYRRLSKSQARVLFIGSDSPDLPLDRFERADRALGDHSCVIVPSDDGGYCLLGLSQPRPELLKSIDWGSENVLRQTLDRSGGDPPLLLPEWRDIDHPQDLADLARRLADLGGSARRRFPQTSQLLRDLGLAV